MNKLNIFRGYISIAVFVIAAFSFAVTAHAEEQVFGFMDGKFYDMNAVLKYFCFLDGNCYDLQGKVAPIKFNPPKTIQPTEQSTPVSQTPALVAPLPVSTLISENVKILYLPNYTVIKLSAKNSDFSLLGMSIVPANKEMFKNLDYRFCEEGSDITKNCVVPTLTYCEGLKALFLEHRKEAYPYECPNIYSNESPDKQFHAFGGMSTDWFGRPSSGWDKVVIPKDSYRYFMYPTGATIPLMKFRATTGEIVDFKF